MSRLERLIPEQLTNAQSDAYEKVIANRSPKSMTPTQAETYKEIIGTKDQKFNLGGPFNALLRSPDLATQVAGLGSFFRFGTSLPPRWVELAIITTARFWTAQYEWYAHARFAGTAGLEDTVIEAIKTNKRPNFPTQDDETIFDFCSQLHTSHQVSDQNYKSAVDLLGEQGVVELIGLIGFYTMVSMTLNTFQVPAPEGAQLPPA